jgi:hypothetical protein
MRGLHGIVILSQNRNKPLRQILNICLIFCVAGKQVELWHHILVLGMYLPEVSKLSLQVSKLSLPYQHLRYV